MSIKRNILQRGVVSNVVRSAVSGVVGSSGFPWSSYWAAEYYSIWSRFPTKPAIDIAEVQNTMMEALAAGGVLAKMDGLIVINETEGQSVLNWVRDSGNLVKYLSTSFTSLFGFKGNSADSSYMDMNFNPSVNGVKWLNDAAHIGCYMNTTVEEDHTFLFGNSGGGSLDEPATGMICRNASWQGKINNGTNGYGEFPTSGRNAGYVVWVRNTDNKLSGYFNAYKQSESAAMVPGTNLPNVPNQIFRNAINGLNQSDNGLAVIHYGGALTDADVALLYSEIDTYLTAIGAAESFKTSKLVDLDFELDTALRRGYWQSVTGAIDFQYAASPISGTKSMHVPAGANYAKLWFPVYSGSVCVKFAIKFPDATPADNYDYFYIRNGVGTTIAYIKLYTTGRSYLVSGGKANYGTTVMNDDTVYYMWFEYIKGTGADSEARLYLNTVDVKPETPECVVTAGNATLSANNIYVYGNFEFIMDDILITPL